MRLKYMVDLGDGFMEGDLIFRRLYVREGILCA